jgi:hypothetical protein
MVPNVVKSREGWELYIVTDGVMVGIISRPFAARTMHFLMMNKRPTNASLIQCIGV